MSLSSEFDRSFRLLVFCGVAQLCRLVRAYEEAMWFATQRTPGLRTDDDKADPVGWAYMLGYFDITFEGGGEMRATQRSNNVTVLAVTRPLPSFAIDAWKQLRGFLEEQGVVEPAAPPEEPNTESEEALASEAQSDPPTTIGVPDMPPAWREYSRMLQEGMSPAQIAQVKGVEADTVNTEISKARKIHGERLFPKRHRQA